MKREELEALVGELATALNAVLKDVQGERVGFVLLLFDFGAEGSFSYAANADRADVVRLLAEARQKIGDVAQ